MVKIEPNFEGLADNYSTNRPQYPQRLLGELNGLLGNRPLLAIDVASGTGISTRAVAKALGDRAQIIGVEPSEDMRRRAAEDTPAIQAWTRSGSYTAAAQYVNRGLSQGPYRAPMPSAGEIRAAKRAPTAALEGQIEACLEEEQRLRAHCDIELRKLGVAFAPPPIKKN